MGIEMIASRIIKITYLAMAFIVVFSLAFADVDQTTVSWVVPTNIAHTITYANSCSTSAFYFVETDATQDGDMNKIIPANDVAGDNNCQDGSSLMAMSIKNDGSVTTDVNMSFTSSLQAGVRFIVWLGDGTHCGTNGRVGWEDVCTKTGISDATVPTTSACTSIGDANKQIIADLTQGTTQGLCFAADFENVAAGTNTDVLESTGWQSAD